MTKKERNKLIYARHKEGYTQKELGKFYGLSQSAISLILIKEKEGSAESEKETRGQKSRLGDSDILLLRELLKHPEKQRISHWNKHSIKSLIKDAFGVDYHENYIWYIMKKIGFSSQRPQKKDYRQNENEVALFKSEKAKALKKSAERK